MFTGIIEECGRVGRGDSPKDSRFVVESKHISREIRIGGSVAVNGVCLTVVRISRNRLFFNLLEETKRRSGLGSLKPGDPVNLEQALRPTSRMEGHFVLGHVDGRGRIRKVVPSGNEKSFLVEFPKAVADYVIEKGSIAVDGVSLTIGKVRSRAFWIHCIPHTLKVTNFHRYEAGTEVNLEADVLLKFLKKLIEKRK